MNQSIGIGRNNYVLNTEVVLRDLYRLLSLVLADDIISNKSVDENDPLFIIRDRFVEDEIVHLLINVAVMNRTHDDHYSTLRSDPSELSFNPISHPCGVLIEGLGNENEREREQPLLLREACNKIIHAQQITVEINEGHDNAFNSLSGVVILRGSRGMQNRISWQANLNIIEYVRATFMNFQT